MNAIRAKTQAPTRSSNHRYNPARIVKNLFRQQTAMGRTVFLCTHVLSVAEELADRIGIFKHGKLIFLGSLQELRTRQGSDATLEELFLELTHEAPV